MTVCPVCNEAALQARSDKEQCTLYSVSCDTCGEYFITKSAMDYLYTNEAIQQKKIMVSSFLKERTLKKLAKITIENYDEDTKIVPKITFDEILQRFPKKVADILDKTLLNLYHLSENNGIYFPLAKRDYSIFYPNSFDLDSALIIFRQLKNDGYIEGSPAFPSRVLITYKGWRRIDELQRGRRYASSNQAFVAMWIHDKMNGPWENGIKRAITAAGYYPRMIDVNKNQKKMLEEVTVELRKSKFLIADLTSHKEEVYFIAGYALGIGLPIIYTCKKENLDDFHFVIKQSDLIIWNNEEDLYHNLLNKMIEEID